MLEKVPPHLLLGATKKKKKKMMYEAKSKVLWAERNLSLSLLNVGRCHALAKSHSVTTSARPLSQLKADASGGRNEEAGHTT